MLGDWVQSARKEKYSDDEIVDHLAQTPDLSGWVSAAKKEGYSSKEILEHIVNSQSSVDKSYSSALQEGVANAGEGVGKTIKQVGRSIDSQGTEGFGKSIEEASGAIKPRNYRKGMDEFLNPTDSEKGFMGYGWSGIPRAAVENAPVLAAGAVTRNPYVAAGLYGLTSLGGNVESRMANNGKDPNKDKASPTDLAAAGATTAAEAIIGGVGVGKITKPIQGGVLEAAKRLGTAAATEATAGAAQDVVGQVGNSAGTDKGVQWDPNQTLGAGLSQGVAGAGVRVPATIRSINGAIANRGISDANMSGEKLANRLQAIAETEGLNLSDPRDAAKALEVSRKQLEEQRNEAFKSVKDILKTDPNSNDSAVLQNLIDKASITEIKKRNGHSEPTGEDAIARINDLIGHKGEGQILVDTLNQINAHKKLQAQGKDFNGKFVGGSAGATGLERLNPKDLLSKLGLLGTGAVGAGGAALATVPTVQTAAAVAALPKVAAVAAAPLATYYGSRALDAALGNRSPVERFVNRFGGSPEVGTISPPTAPSIVLEKAQAAQARNDQRQASFDLRDQLTQGRIDNLPLAGDVLKQRAAVLAATADLRKAQAAGVNDVAQARVGTEQARQGVNVQRQATEAQRTATAQQTGAERLKQATIATDTKAKTSDERVKQATIGTETKAKTGQKAVEAATSRAEAAKIRTETAKARQQLADLKLERAKTEPRTPERAAVDKKIEKAKAKVEKTKPEASSSSTDDGAVPIKDKKAWSDGALRRNTTLNKALETFSTSHDVSQGTKTSLSKLGSFDNKQAAISHLEKVAKSNPKIGDALMDHFYEGGAKNKDNVINRVFKYKTQEAADNASRRK